MFPVAKLVKSFGTHHRRPAFQAGTATAQTPHDRRTRLSRSDTLITAQRNRLGKPSDNVPRSETCQKFRHPPSRPAFQVGTATAQTPHDRRTRYPRSDTLITPHATGLESRATMFPVAKLVKSFGTHHCRPAFQVGTATAQTHHDRCPQFSRADNPTTPHALGLESRVTMFPVAKLVKSFGTHHCRPAFQAGAVTAQTPHDRCTRFSRSDNPTTPHAIGLESRATLFPVAKLVKSFGTPHCRPAFQAGTATAQTPHDRRTRFSRVNNPTTPHAIGLESRATMFPVAKLVISFGTHHCRPAFQAGTATAHTPHDRCTRYSRSDTLPIAHAKGLLIY
ncbi:hypothetical protein Rcae01_05853 [Novipirellula caenicola]|uniref:Uncharacterized protein n=1 Tax=Novipirellula caenicola TaxID=1536901 RepID=A0ABP9VYY5_9BACT